MVHDRRVDVLRAIVSDYVSTREPVGSRGLVERHNLGVSPATVRNDMAALEEGGYIYQPHTSAGRIPTDKGYRLFVDQISQIKPLSIPERRAITHFLADAADVDDVMDRTVRLLAQLTRQVAVVQYPTLRHFALRHVELVPLGTRRILVVVIAENGQITQQPVEIPVPIADTLLRQLGILLNQNCGGLRGPDLSQALGKVPEVVPVPLQDAAQAVTAVLQQSLETQGEQRIVVAGTAHLARADLDFHHTIGPVLDALEEQVALLRLFSELESTDVNVSIGAENRHDGLVEASVVAGAYAAEAGTVAHLGVVGPTRMDYPGTMATVSAVARYLSRFLKA